MKKMSAFESREIIEREAAQFTWEESIKVRRHKKHHFSVTTSGTSACGRGLSGLWDNSTAHWPSVTCRRCRASKPKKARGGGKG